MSRLLLLSTLLLSIQTIFSQKNVRTFVFGHSLINHEFQVNETPSQETSVPHWFHFMAEQAGHNYAIAGKYGFLPQHADTNNVFAQWGFDSVQAAWDSDFESFSDANFTNILIVPGNFIQWQGPDEGYWENGVQQSYTPISLTTDIFTWCINQEASMKYYIYEGWPDMGQFLGSGFPPSQSEWNAYNDYILSHNHNWFVEYYEAVSGSFPNECIQMIPIASIISKLLATAPFDQMAIDSLYEDDAPHGRPSIYFLASMISYMAMYEEECPPSYAVDDIIEPIIRDNYDDIVDFIRAELTEFDKSPSENRVFCNPLNCTNSISRDSLTFNPIVRMNSISSTELIKDSSAAEFYYEQSTDLINGFSVEGGASLTITQQDCPE